MKRKNIILPFEIKSFDEETRTFEGYASYYGNVDLGRDIMMPGVFADSIKTNKGKVPVLLDHDARIRSQAGYSTRLVEDEKGLLATTSLNNTDAADNALEVIRHAKQIGAKVGLSVGFQTDEDQWNDKKRAREIKKASLFEYSVVVFPMNPKARVKSVKDITDEEEIISKKRHIEQILRDEGCSNGEAKRAISAIFLREEEKDGFKSADIEETINNIKKAYKT